MGALPRRQPPNACSARFIPKTFIISKRGLVMSILAICTGLVCSRSAFYELRVAAVAPGGPGKDLSASGDEGSSSGARRAGAGSSKNEEEEKRKSETAGAPGAPGAAGSLSREQMLRRRAHLKLSLSPRESPLMEMAPAVRHSCLQRFSALLSSVPPEAPPEEKAKKFVDAIVVCGIKVVAVDFDYTILTIHTGGGWPVSRLPELQGKLASDFVEVAQELNRREIPIYVVTFSDPQDNAPEFGRIGANHLVEEALRVNGTPFSIMGIVAMRPDLNSDPARYQALGLNQPPERNKSFHIHRVSAETGVLETDILLVDDDRVNVVKHFKTGGLSVWVKGPGFSFSNIEVVTSASLV